MRRTAPLPDPATPRVEPPASTNSMEEDDVGRRSAVRKQNRMSILNLNDPAPIKDGAVRSTSAQNERTASKDKQVVAGTLKANDGDSTAPRPAAIVEKYPRPRTANLRVKSTAVIDEAADDPGFRFVVISMLFFVLFLLLLVVSYLLE